MKIAITSQNFRTITGHAGKTRRFLVYQVDNEHRWEEVARLDLPKEMSLHEYKGDDHPVYDVDIVITASCGENFRLIIIPQDPIPTKRPCIFLTLSLGKNHSVP